MTRLLCRLTMFISLGIATSVVVAWLCAIEAKGKDASTGFVEAYGPINPDRGCRVDLVTGDVRWGSAYYRASSGMTFCGGRPRTPARLPADQWVPRWSRASLEMIRPRTTSSSPVVLMLDDLTAAFATGWPFLCVHCQPYVELTNGGASWACRGGFTLPIHSPIGADAPVMLAYWPIGAGLIADTALYSSVWSALFIVPWGLRRRRRRRHGLCHACGYSLAGNTTGVCPECGRRAA